MPCFKKNIKRSEEKNAQSKCKLQCPVYRLVEGCTLTPADLSKPYPDCCPRPNCPKSVAIQGCYDEITNKYYPEGETWDHDCIRSICVKTEGLYRQALVRYIAEEWGPCSVSCGKGIRRRVVDSKNFLETSRTNANSSDTHCLGPRPEETQMCTWNPCPVYDPTVQITNRKYTWKEQGFTDCSASCLGGIQESIVNCIREDNQKVVSVYLCHPDTRPISVVRSCNEHACPPRWNYSDYQPCSKSCGFGIQIREVKCIKEDIQEGVKITVLIPTNMCPPPAPREHQYCNAVDCPVEWLHTEWSKCSKRCGGGVKETKVTCRQVMALNHIMIIPPAKCDPRTKPKPVVRSCNKRACLPKWNYSDFQPCSTSCGIGIQTREVNCIKEGDQRGNIIVIPNHMCPQPPPLDRQSCRVLDCPVKWYPTKWSKCSKSCGGGIKERKIECKQEVEQNYTVVRPQAMCPSSKPLERKSCNIKSCVLESDKPEIVSNSSYMQMVTGFSIYDEEGNVDIIRGLNKFISRMLSIFFYNN